MALIPLYEFVCVSVCVWRGGRPTTKNSHILLIFSSEPPQNSRPIHRKRCLFVEHCLWSIYIFYTFKIVRENFVFFNIILKRRGFWGGSDEKMRRMWLGRYKVVVGLPPLVYVYWSDRIRLECKILKILKIPI